MTIEFLSPLFFIVLFFIFCIVSFLFYDKITGLLEKLSNSLSLNLFKPEEQGDFFFSDSPSTEQRVGELIEDTKIKFSDVAGNEEAKEELKEIVKFLKDPNSFAKLGALLPKGVLLAGPPGTGKTLFAKAIAGEAGVPFLQASGSQFVELLVGVGAARVRELFELANDLKPCIIFIDEIDSIARARSTNNNMGGGNDEREQTLNQILTEMDGFQSQTGVVVIAATNRIDILDPAITRPGRFDRQITIQNPNLQERQAILKVHAKGKKFDNTLSFLEIAQRTPGFSGAELANLLNEAAILTARKGKKVIGMTEINVSIDRILMGIEGQLPNRLKVKYLIAFHEVGHAIIASILDQKVQKLSLIPRGNSKGTTWFVPSSSQYLSRQNFIEQALIGLSGRVMEDVIGGPSEVSVGAQQDIDQLTRNFRILITRYAMTKLQELKQESQTRNLFLLGTDVKQEITNIVDNFTTNFLDITYQELFTLLFNLRPGSERLVDQLILEEELSSINLKNLLFEYLSKIESSEMLVELVESTLFEILFPQNISDFEELTKFQTKKIEKFLQK
jgi:cell division protease FtsH